MTAYAINQDAKGNWPSDPTINLNDYDSITWTATGSVAPTVTGFSRSQNFGSPSSNGSSTTVPVNQTGLQHGVPAPVSYTIGVTGFDDTPAQMELEVGGP